MALFQQEWSGLSVSKMIYLFDEIVVSPLRMIFPNISAIRMNKQTDRYECE